jgi:hypothetical protein
LPNAYLPELIKESGEDAVRANLETHFISPTAFDILVRNPFTPGDFERFISERHRTMVDAIEQLLVKERLDLSPTLRELDSAVERVELAIRGLVEQKVTEGGAAIPSHIEQFVNERIGRDVRKGLVDENRMKALSFQLEYFDLRELQDVITAKALWPIFAGIFPTKEVVVSKFGQLAEVRNGLRHSRSVSDVVRKEGEAAILWFEDRLQPDRNAK